jgi:hypothetical protein
VSTFISHLRAGEQADAALRKLLLDAFPGAALIRVKVESRGGSWKHELFAYSASCRALPAAASRQDADRVLDVLFSRYQGVDWRRSHDVRLPRAGRVSVHASPGRREPGGLPDEDGEFGPPRPFWPATREGRWDDAPLFVTETVDWMPKDGA